MGAGEGGPSRAGAGSQAGGPQAVLGAAHWAPPAGTVALPPRVPPPPVLAMRISRCPAPSAALLEYTPAHVTLLLVGKRGVASLGRLPGARGHWVPLADWVLASVLASPALRRMI